MKKTFKIIISAIICMALLLVPMTVMAEEGVTYNINYEANLTVGTNNYATDSTVPYTVYIFYPTAVGDYTFTSEAKMGIVSYLDMWVQFEPTDEIVNLNEIKWTCTDVNQSIMIGVESDLSEVSITVNWSDPTVVEIPWTVYENKKAPEKFEMPDFVNVDAFDDGYVDFEDDNIDDAVLGDDGYYHLNDKNGPVLFANINDSIMSLYTMVGYGKIAAIYYDENGDVSKKVDYTNAFNEYVAALPADANGTITSYYYPLTADLIEMFKEVGTTHNWYDGDSPWVYASDDAWLYACYYDEAVTSMGTTNNDNNDDGDKGDDTTNTPSDDNTTDDKTTTDSGNNTTQDTTNNNTNTDTSTTAPATGDSTVALAVAMISAAAVVVGLKSKK
ncbi:MAG: hypothetical protein IJN56_03570 [Clostridia bacterium]|nr:hypothetical protein [Clostridia bacterium]